MGNITTPLLFEQPKIRERTSQLFFRMNKKFLKRYCEIQRFLEDRNYSISYIEIHRLFKANFYELLLSSVDICSPLNVHDQILDKLDCEQNFEDALMGEPMIEAFQKVITELPCKNAFEKTDHGSSILLLHKKFIEKSI